MTTKSLVFAAAVGVIASIQAETWYQYGDSGGKGYGWDASKASAEAIRVTWIGGAEGRVDEATNWEGGVIPSSTSKAYIPVITNSVRLSAASTGNRYYWYVAGMEVSNNANVEYVGQRLQPTSAVKEGEYVFDIETGSSLTFNGTLVYGSKTLPVVKKGGGDMVWSGTCWCGYSSNWFSLLDVQGGLVQPGNEQKRNFVSNLVVRAGATFRNNASVGISPEAKPVFHVEKGGVLDLNGKSLTLCSLSGDGVVTNANNVLTITLGREPDAVFAGRIYGTVRLTNVTDVAASWVIGDRETMRNATIQLQKGDVVDPVLLFKEGIHRFVSDSTVLLEGSFYDRQGLPVTIEASGKDWFVDPTRPDDSGDGTKRETAFRTLKAAMANAKLKSGDTVWALPGEYKEGFSAPSASATSNRVVVAAGVKLVSTDGPEKTFIIGADSPEPTEGKYGCGPGAIRCAMLKSGSVIRGFTLTGGRTGGQNGGGVTYQNEADNGWIEDCVISNCVASRGGGANYVRCNRTRFYDNQATDIGAAVHHGSVYNCLFDGNTNGTHLLLYPAEVVNCTFLPGNKGDAVHVGSSYTAQTVRNSVFLSKPADSRIVDKPCYTQCVFLDAGAGVSDANIGAGSFRVSVADAKLDADGRPLADSPLRDAGDNDLHPFLSTGDWWLDAAGGERVQNSVIDIGAYEFDASDDIAVALGRRSRLAVVLDEVTFGVKAVKAPKGVTMNGSFQKLSATLTGTAGVTDEYKLTVSVTGEGTLVVTSGGETVGTLTAADGAQTYGIAAGSDPTKLEFAFSGTGTANIGRLKSTLGMLILFR